jgi:SAM-dependent methyltransferase
MKTLDRLIQRMRFRKVAHYIPPGTRLLDIGCADGALFRLLSPRLAGGLGIDPDLAAPVRCDGYDLLPGSFPDDLPADILPFDAITLLAVLEHVPPAQQPRFAQACARCLKPAGFLVVTVPSRQVDTILDALIALRLIDGMLVEEHYGFNPKVVPAIFQPAGFTLVKMAGFQLGLNNLFIFQKQE